MAILINNSSEDPRKKELRELFKKNSYTKLAWKTSAEDVYTCDHPFILELAPELEFITGDPHIITKMGEKDGRLYTFKKVIFPIEDGEKEMELSKNKTAWSDGDIMPLDKVRICVERYHTKSHLYVDIIDNLPK